MRPVGSDPDEARDHEGKLMADEKHTGAGPNGKDVPDPDRETLAVEALRLVDELFATTDRTSDFVDAKNVAREAIIVLAGVPSRFDDRTEMLGCVRRAAREIDRPELVDAFHLTSFYMGRLTRAEGAAQRMRARAYVEELRGLGLVEFNDPAPERVVAEMMPTARRGRPRAPQGVLAAILDAGPKFADAVRDEVRKHEAKDPGG